MKNFCLEDFKNFERVEGYVVCPTGDYSGIEHFPDIGSYVFDPFCHFGDECDFGSTSNNVHYNFGTGCRFRDWCKFAKMLEFRSCCVFGEENQFDIITVFGDNCTFFDDCEFKGLTRFGEGCEFHRCQQFGSGILFGDSCTFERGERPTNAEAVRMRNYQAASDNKERIDALVEYILAVGKLQDDIVSANLLCNALTVLDNTDNPALKLMYFLNNTGGQGREIVNEFIKINAPTKAGTILNLDIAIWFLNEYFPEKSKLWDITYSVRAAVAECAFRH